MAKKNANGFKIKESRMVLIGDGGEQLVKVALERKEEFTRRGSTFTAFAAPMIFGPDVTVFSHIGKVTIKISYQAVGSTLVLAQVTYYKGPDGGQQVTEEFRDETTITTANAVANVVCAFKGIPTGSAVNGTVAF